MKSHRRSLALLAMAAVMAMGAAGAQEAKAPLPAKTTRIAFIGAGRIGGSYAQLFAEAGYPVMISARDLGKTKAEAAQIGHGVQAGTPDEAAAFGDVVIVSVPYGQLGAVAQGQGAALKGKIVVDTNNPKREEYITMSAEARALGSGIVDQRLFAGSRLVKGLDTISSTLVLSAAHQPGERAGIPLAADDKAALATVATLVRDIGYEPVIAGGLDSAKIFDSYTPFHSRGTANTAAQVRRMLAEKPLPIAPEEVRRLGAIAPDQLTPEDRAKLKQYSDCCSF